MVEHYNIIDESFQFRLKSLVHRSNVFDHCNQPYMLDNDNEFFPEIPKFYVIKDTTDIHSFISIYFIDDNTVYLYGFTHPKFRKQGYMKQLLANVQNTLNPLNVTSYIVPLSNDNTGGIHFVKHYGSNYLETECHMVCPLDKINSFPHYEEINLQYARNNDISIYTLCSSDDFHELGKVYCLTDRTSAAIFDVEIYNNYRGCGYGSKMLSLVMEQLKNIGILSITLHVTKENAPAYNLYMKHGFDEIETILYYQLI